MAKKKKKGDDDEAPKKKKKKAADVDDDDDDRDDNEDDSPAIPKKPSKNDAYTGLLILSLLAFIVSSVFFYLDHTELSVTQVPQPSLTMPSLGQTALMAAGPQN
jgi:hypothetical protein